MLKSFLPTLILVSFFTCSSLAQCFTDGGLEDYESGSITNNFLNLAEQGFGQFSSSTQDPYSGTTSLKVELDQAANWQVRMISQSACNFNVVSGQVYILSFYARSTVSRSEMNIALLGGGTVSQSVFLTDSWELYIVPLEADFNSNSGSFRIQFKNQGAYFLDEIALDRHDCHGDIGGAAAIDACGVCAGGNTGVVFQNTCDLQTILPNDPNIYFEGVVEKELTPSKASFYRFKKAYALDENGGQPRLYYRRSRAVASAGVVMKVKTASPNVVINLLNNNSLGSALNDNKPKAIYKNNILQGFENEDEISLINENGSSVVWSVIFPVFNWYELLSIETVSGFDLEPITEPAKPAYVAIGNSITQGTGTTLQRSTPTYSRKIADHYGYELYNWGVGGSYIYSGVTSNFDGTGLDPELITLLWGFNDVNSRGDAYIYSDSYPHYDTLIGDLCTRFPQATIMAILPITADPNNVNETPISNLDSMRLNQQYIVEKYQASCPNLYYMKGADYTTVNEVPDGVHPNDDGNQSIADGIITELDDLILSNENDRQVDVFNVFPNPTNGILNIGSSEYLEIKLFGLNGQLIKSFDRSRSNQLDLGGLSEGTYLLKLTDVEGTSFSQRLLIE